MTSPNVSQNFALERTLELKSNLFILQLGKWSPDQWCELRNGVNYRHHDSGQKCSCVFPEYGPNLDFTGCTAREPPNLESEFM